MRWDDKEEVGMQRHPSLQDTYVAQSATRNKIAQGFLSRDARAGWSEGLGVGAIAADCDLYSTMKATADHHT